MTAYKEDPARMFALNEVNLERNRQIERWGEQNHDDGTWSMILGEEVGELNQAQLHKAFGGHKGHMRMYEATQVAAVAVAYVEMLYRHKTT